jgi:hypothetical protein
MEKLRRADVHLILLHNEIGSYMNSARYGLQGHRDAGAGDPGFTFHIADQPPLRISCIVGDILHNVRSALDYIARELIMLNDCTPQWSTQFPICTTEHDFLNESLNRNRLGGISRRAFKMIDACQPYKWDQKYTIHPLWHLHKLSNLDKHKTLALAGIGANCVFVFTHPDGRQFRSEFKTSIVHDGAIVGSMPIDFFDEKVKSQIKVTCHVAFTDAPVLDLEVLNVLHNLRKFVGEFVLPLIEPFFDDLPDTIRLSHHGLPPTLIEAIGFPVEPPFVPKLPKSWGQRK